jgi:hypothetical protein
VARRQRCLRAKVACVILEFGSHFEDSGEIHVLLVVQRFVETSEADSVMCPSRRSEDEGTLFGKKCYRS